MMGSGEEQRVARRGRRGGLGFGSWLLVLLELELARDVRVSVLWRWSRRI
jgi:hypothetical protein